MPDRITVRLPRNQNEYYEASTLIETIYKEKHYVDFLEGNPSLLLLSIARENQRDILSGAIGIVLSSESPRFPTEQYFNFHLSNFLSEEFDREEVFEISRLGAKGVSSLKSLLIAVCDYATRFDLKYALACIKPQLLHILQHRFEIPLHRIDAKVFPPAIPPQYRGYFLTEPRPVPIWIPTDEARSSIMELRESFPQELRIVINSQTNSSKKLPQSTP